MGEIIRIDRHHITGMVKKYTHRGVQYKVYSSYIPERKTDPQENPRSLRERFENVLVQSQQLTGRKPLATICSKNAASAVGKEKYEAEV